jgi:hypothetical protein
MGWELEGNFKICLYRENPVTKLSATSQGETSGSAATVGVLFLRNTMPIVSYNLFEFLER